MRDGVERCRSCSKHKKGRSFFGCKFRSRLSLCSADPFQETKTFVEMAVNPPSIVAWSSQAELDQLKSWFYDPQPSSNPGEPSVDMRQRAINRVTLPQNTSADFRFKHIKLAPQTFLPK